LQSEPPPFERRAESKAAVSPDYQGPYVQGCLFGGDSTSFWKLCETLRQQVDDDLKRGIIAQWHDESHLNAYFSRTEAKVLDSGFAYPEGCELNLKPRIIHLKKNHDLIRANGWKKIRIWASELVRFCKHQAEKTWRVAGGVFLRKRVTVRIHAGMGNQMFQYAMGKSLSLQKHGDLVLDVSGYETDTFRKYELGRFNISTGLLSRRRKDLETQLRRRLYTPLRWLLRAIRSPLVPRHIADAERGFEGGLADIKGSLYLDGYWQSEKYFRGIRELLLKEFTFKNEPNLENAKCLASITTQNAVCVHIRRGDYVTTPHGQTKHGVCPLDYYRKAIAYIRERTADPVFFIFSDDPSWVASNFQMLNSMTIISHNVGQNDSEDLRLMMNCRHFIIGNSSFSWWAAWLGKLPEKIVIAPARWFVSPNQSDKDLVPTTWVRL
jgi:hypothetical protein